MRRFLPILTLLLAWAGSAPAHGLLIPEEKTLPPLAMLNHKVTITIEDQVAVTRVEQTFRNHTDRQLEATYIFPVPKGASVNKFTMWVDGKEVKGELVEADKAREIYTDIVRRTQDPGLLEYIGNNLLRMQRLPRSRPHGDQKVAAQLHRPSPATQGTGRVHLPAQDRRQGDGDARRSSASSATIKSQHAVQNVYSPTHAITIKRTNDQRGDRSASTANQGLLDKDFQLFYSLGDKDVGLTALTHRPISSRGRLLHAAGLAARSELAKEYAGAARHGVGAGHLRQHARRQDGPGQEGAEVLPATTSSKNDRFAVHQLRHHGQPLPATSLLDADSGAARRRRASGSMTSKRPAAPPSTTPCDAALDTAPQGRGPDLHRRLLHRRPADHRRDQPRQDPQEHRRPRTRPTRASSPSASATTSTPPARPAGRADTRASAPTSGRQRTSRPRSAACTARSAIPCWPT